MVETSGRERRRGFSIWLRTGRLPSIRNADGVELKFSPWHDTENGRFTFVGAGRHHGQWGGGGFNGGGGDGFGGAGASGTWRGPESERRPISSRGSATTIGSLDRFGASSAASPRPASTQDEHFRSVVRNGYTYQIDARERTRRVSGMLTVATVPSRSRSAQRQAGGAERRASDDGGHYIAVRFKGPTEAFNHFAQDANFNRGSYRLLEDEWARDKRAGRKVTVKIVPQFGGASVRPSRINVWWTVDGKEKSANFPNERSEKRRGGN